jgi:predicted nucleotidyltransferase
MKLSYNQINTIKEYFSKQPVLKAYLFGSYVRGEETENSDIDVLVELDYTQPIGLEFIQMQIDLQKLLSKKVDLVLKFLILLRMPSRISFFIMTHNGQMFILKNRWYF